MKKKKGVIVLCIVLAVLLIGGGVGYSFLPHPLNYNINKIASVGSSVSIVRESADSVTVRKEGGGDFKVLMFTDMHLDGKNKTSNLTVDWLVKNIQNEKPDLVLLGGDNVTSGLNRSRAKQLGKIFEKLGVYWAGVLGNHEGDNKWSIKRSEMVDIFASFDHCLMRRGPETVTGDCNYVLYIENPDGTLQQTFYFLDSFDELNDAEKEKYGWQEGTSPYNGPQEDQVAWYSAKVKETEEKYGAHDSVMLIHIPLYEVAAACETEPYVWGEKREKICSTGFQNGLFAAIKEGGSTKAVFFGHDHTNNFGLELDGVLLSYIEMSGYGSYSLYSKGYPESDWLQGYTKLIIHSDGTFEHTQVRNHAAN